MTIEELDALSKERAREELERCCGATRWIDSMIAARPFGSKEGLLAAADRADAALSDDDWLEAFRHHPRIGDIDSLRKKFASTAAWASGEQAGTASASEEVLQGLAEGNARYEDRNGFIFSVCATGKSASEMLAILNERLGNDRATELRIAAGEQAKITRLRLEKLLS